LNYGRGFPYDLRGRIALNKSSFYALESSWSTKGAQELPFGVLAIDKATIESILDESSVMYLGGSVDNQISCFMTR
jgi:hypothetical protein